MQHDHVLKKRGGGGVCEQNMCYRVAAFRDSHYCMQHDHVLNKLNFDLPLLTPSPRLEGGGGLRAKYQFATMLLHL